MANLLPLDLVEALRTGLAGVESERSQNLYCGSDLIGPLRHSMLRVAGAPTVEPELVGEVVMQTGNFWHEWFGRRLVKMRVPFMQEVSLKPWLPEGWSGTADWIFWHPEYEAFVLGDLKTTKGESLQYTRKEGIKDTHLWQLSAYWYALERMGIPLAKGFTVMYLPMNNVPREQTEPILLEGMPIDRDIIQNVMESRWAATQEYLAEVEASRYDPGIIGLNMKAIDADGNFSPVFLQPSLAPPMEREQRLFWDAKQGVWNVVLVPHWSTRFCPYSVELCDCSTQGTNKVGHWFVNSDHEEYPLTYKPRKGYEAVEPTVKPSQREVERLG